MNRRPVVRDGDGTRPDDAPRRFAPCFVLTAASHLDKMKYFCKALVVCGAASAAGFSRKHGGSFVHLSLQE